MTAHVVRFVAVPRFTDDVAHYVVRPADIDGIKRNLARDPFLGEAVPGRPGLFDYHYRGEIVTYAVAADFGTIYLVAIRPHDLPTGGASPDIDKWLDRLGKAQKLWSMLRGG